MGAVKRYFWLKLSVNFFSQKKILAIHSMENGHMVCNLYLRMLTESLSTDYILFYEHIFPTIEEELALQFREDVENIRAAVACLEKMGLMLRRDDGSLFLPEAEGMTGSETDSAKRMRSKRAHNVQKSDVEKEIELELEKEMALYSDRTDVEIEGDVRTGSPAVPQESEGVFTDVTGGSTWKS